MPTTKALRDYDRNEVSNAIDKAQAKEAPTNLLFIQGDHWQNGFGWVGPRPAPGDEGAAEVLTEIRRAFTSRNTILEVCTRHRDGVIGREPNWHLTPVAARGSSEELSDEEETTIDEEEAALTFWWDRRQAHRRMQDAVLTMLHQERALLRLLVPRGLMQTVVRNDGERDVTDYVASATTLQGAMRLIHLDEPSPEDAAVLQDPFTMEEVGLLTYKVDDSDVAEIYFVDEDPDNPEEAVTRIRVISEDGVANYDFDIGGQNLMHEMHRDILITEQVQEQQRALNLAVSMVPRTVVTAGFLERVITGAQMPGYFVDDASSPTGKRFVRMPMHVGPGSTNFLSPEIVHDREGKAHLANPSVTFRDPVSPEAAVKAKHSHYEDILHETSQAHFLLTSNQYVSAVSRVEARMDFLNSLRSTQAVVESAGRWLLETVVALARMIVRASGGNAGEERLRATFQCRLQVGQLSAEEQRIVIERWEKGLISTEDAMVMMDVEDVDAMITKINSQPGRLLELSKRQAEAYKAWTDAAAPMEFAAEKAGLTPEEVKELMKPQDPAEAQVTNPVPADA